MLYCSVLYCTQITSEEKRAEERLQYAGLYDKARKAAEVHRQVRRHAQSYIKPGIKLIDMCTMLEEKVCSRLRGRENGEGVEGERRGGREGGMEGGRGREEK